MAIERGKILIVDDEETVRSLLKETLEEVDYNVSTAANGQEALAEVSQTEIEVMLLDIKMPGISGMDVLRRLTAEWPNICVIMVTAMVNTQTAVEAMKLGAYDYITKPFNLDDVVLNVQKAIERRKLQLQNERYQRQLKERVIDQTERIQTQFTELVETLAREHKLLHKLEALHHPKKDDAVPLSKLPPELQEPMSTVEEFRDALLRILRRNRM